jgi:hypothetical protein
MATKQVKMSPAKKSVQTGGKGNSGTKGGKTNEQLAQLGTGLARAAANGKAY